jgi:hypothetical protein
MSTRESKRKIVNMGNKSISIDISPIINSNTMSFSIMNNIFSGDTDIVLRENFSEAMSLQFKKRPLKPGNFSTKSYTNYVPRLGPRSAKWEGPLQDFQSPDLEIKAIDRMTGQEINKSVNSSERFSEILNMYLNNQYNEKIFLEKEYCKVLYKNLNNQWVTASNPERDYFDCFGYNFGSIPSVSQQSILQNKTGNPGNLVPHELELNIVFLPQKIKFKTTNSVNIQSHRILNNNNLEPKKCVDFPLPGKYIR